MKNRWTKATHCLSNGKFEEFENMIKDGFDINNPDNTSIIGNTLLYYFLDCYDISEFLLKSGADPNIVPYHGGVVLNIYCKDNGNEVVRYRFIKLLLRYGAKGNIIDNYGKTAFDYVYEKNDSKVLKLFLQYKENFTISQIKKLEKFKLRALLS